MPEDTVIEDISVETDTSAEEAVSRIYEVGYHIVPTIAEQDLESAVSSIRKEIASRGGSFIAEGAPQLMRLAYDIQVQSEGKFTNYDRGYFGWIKFEAPATTAKDVTEALKANKLVMRAMVFKTIREDTRAQLKTGLREVRRTDTIKSTPRREEQGTVEVSEADLDKALEVITAE